MSTQNATGVEFSLLPEDSHHHFRLLELPPELLSLLTSDDPPVLQLKAPDGAAEQPLDSNAVLCTSSKTYDLRQVSTSNSLFITQTKEDNEEDGSSDFAIPRLRLEAIAQSTSTLELIAQKPSSSAASYIKASLPIYSSTGHSGATKQGTKRDCFDSVPLSDVECEQAWTELACFELSDPPRCFIPSLAVQWRVWQSMKIAADAEGTNLSERLTDTQRGIMVKEADDVPLELAGAVLRSLSTSWDEAGFAIDGQKCARFVGAGVLHEKYGNGGAVSTSEFVETWKNHLPRQWEDLADVKLLSTCSQTLDGGQHILYAETPIVSANGSAEESKSTLGSKRKWHEKFRAAKKAA